MRFLRGGGRFENLFSLIISSKPLEKFSRTTFRWSVPRNVHARLFYRIFFISACKPYARVSAKRAFFAAKCGDFFREGVSRIFFRVTLKAFIRIQMTVWTIQNDYLDYVRQVWDILETIRPLKIIFWDQIFENFRLKMSKNTFFGSLCLNKGTYYLLKIRNEEFRWLRFEYMTLIIS